MKFTKDRQLGLICLLITAFITWQCSQITIRKAQFQTVGPKTFPMIAAVIFAICGIALLVKKPSGQEKTYMTPKQFGRAMLMFGCYVLYLALLYFVGLRFAAPVAVFLMTMLFGKGKTTWWKALIFSVVFGIVFYVLYAIVFQIRVPRGIL